jgi:hypothetical protein
MIASYLLLFLLFLQCCLRRVDQGYKGGRGCMASPNGFSQKWGPPSWFSGPQHIPP